MNFKSYTPEQLQSARDYAAEIPLRSSVNCFKDDFGYADHVTDEQKIQFSKQYKLNAESIKKGEKDHNFTIAQRMHYFLTGECVGLLAK
jgi:hypothetical protein